MGNFTYKNYIEEIKAKYDVEKGGIYSCYLSKPSPALLNDYCKILKQNELSKKDQEIIDLFYGKPNFDVDKFRPICNFFNGKTKYPSQDILDMMAFLVDFKPRPLGDFLKISKTKTIEEGKENKIKEDENLEEENTKKNIVKVGSEIPEFSKKRKKIILTSIILSLGLLSFIYFNFIEHKPCLEWQNDRYIEADCEVETNGFVSLNTKVPYNEDLLLLRKIVPTDTTTYFKKGKAIVWYCKDNNGELELFNAPGHHPVSDKPLKAITPNMIKKYLKK